MHIYIIVIIIIIIYLNNTSTNAEMYEGGGSPPHNQEGYSCVCKFPECPCPLEGLKSSQTKKPKGFPCTIAF